MPPPPSQPQITPSPHRFVLKKPRPVAAPLEPPLSTSTQPRSHTPVKTQAHSKQFNATPRFSFVNSQRTSPSRLGVGLTPLRLQAAPTEDVVIRDILDIEDDDDGEGRDEDEILHDSIEANEGLEDEPQGWISNDEEMDIELGFAERAINRRAKRRRISNTSPDTRFRSDHDMEITQESPEYEHDHELDGEKRKSNDFEDLLSSAPTVPSPPLTTAKSTKIPHQLPRFLPHPSTPLSKRPSTSLTTDTVRTPNATPFVKPPRFLAPKPPHGEGETVEPLPDAFSPHRRGKKYLPGGLASEVASWLLDFSDHNPSSSSVVWPIKLRAGEVSGGPSAGMILVRGQRISLTTGTDAYSYNDGNSGVEEVRIILAGDGGSDAAVRNLEGRGGVSKDVVIGSLVGIKGRGWEVELLGLRWVVSLRWEVLG